MEEIEKIEPKLPNQEIDYFKIGKILLSRWYWIAGSIITCFILANFYLFYTGGKEVRNIRDHAYFFISG